MVINGFVNDSPLKQIDSPGKYKILRVNILAITCVAITHFVKIFSANLEMLSKLFATTKVWKKLIGVYEHTGDSICSGNARCVYEDIRDIKTSQFCHRNNNFAEPILRTIGNPEVRTVIDKNWSAHISSESWKFICAERMINAQTVLHRCRALIAKSKWLRLSFRKQSLGKDGNWP